MNGYVTAIEKDALANDYFRRVIYTVTHCQLVLMSLPPGSDIGKEVHDGDQFLRVEQGSGKAILNGIEHEIADGSAILVPAGVEHNIINTSQTNPMKLYTLYAPPHHRDGVIHATKHDSDSDLEHFDGKTTEV